LQPAVKPRLSAGYLSNRQQGNNYACESDYRLVQSRIAAIGVQWPVCAVAIMLIAPDHRG